jgi:hypothetical protein
VGGSEDPVVLSWQEGRWKGKWRKVCEEGQGKRQKEWWKEEQGPIVEQWQPVSDRA